jgi:hypothetical protein
MTRLNGWKEINLFEVLMFLEFHLSLQILQWLMISMHSHFPSYQVVQPVLKLLAHMHTSLYHRFNTSQQNQRCPLS